MKINTNNGVPISGIGYYFVLKYLSQLQNFNKVPTFPPRLLSGISSLSFLSWTLPFNILTTVRN